MHVDSSAGLALILLLSLALWLWVAVDVRGRVDLSGPTKRGWIVAALLFPVPVSIVYLAIGRRRPNG